jgi:hypothetical protein
LHNICTWLVLMFRQTMFLVVFSSPVCRFCYRVFINPMVAVDSHVCQCSLIISASHSLILLVSTYTWLFISCWRIDPLFYAMLFFILHNPHWFHGCSLWTKCHNSWFLSLLFSWYIFVTSSYFLFKCIFILKMFLTDHMYISLLHSKYFFPFSLFI